MSFIICKESTDLKAWFKYDKEYVGIYQKEHGVYHREDGLALEYKNGTKEWYVNGLRHRVDGPAIESSNGERLWYLKGRLNRENGPAIEHMYGTETKEWWLDGLRHRIDGPDCTYKEAPAVLPGDWNGNKEYSFVGIIIPSTVTHPAKT